MIKVNAMIYANLIVLMMDGAYTLHELADETGLHYLTVCQYTRAIYKAGAAHITAWQFDSRGFDSEKIYKIGPGKDAKRRKLTGAQRQARVREWQKAHKHAQVMAGKARYVKARNGRLRFELVEQVSA